MDEQKITNRLLAAILLLMIFATVFFAKDVVLPVVIGILLSLTLGPVVRKFRRLGVPAVISSAILILGFCGIIGTGVGLLGGSVSSWFDDIPRIEAEVRQKLRGLTDSVEAVQEAAEQVEEIASGEADSVQTVVVQQPGLITAAVSNLASFVTSLTVGLILALFLLSSGNLFYEKIIESFPNLSGKKAALTAVYEIERSISHYLLAITLINAALGLAVGLAMFAIGVPYAFVWGVAAFFLNYLPFVGGVVGTLGVAGFSIVSFDSITYAVLAPITYLLLTSIEAQFVTPYLLGKRLQLNTVAVFITVIFWGWLWGIPGALMAVPILVLVKVICDHVSSLSTFGNFLGARVTQNSLQD
ncbi:Predicted PurR-regulated permease PerM [Cognatiyoonia koreensis]|uniref:Predicted PurR-regulated permease PerM n=1 Tax=Cognatiyoonia koreensis TaxID=364200 RepID=A0A1I0N9K6_9RHOB|nr:AI-2E family transporter [Cognatiyoonia koreensis]SEV97939.1 Predicted PurR-regulated permease PerM [Cognatiyoonia koreensis]